MGTKIKIILAEDKPLLRTALISLLKNYEVFEVTGEASNGKELLTLLKRVKSDVVLLDIEMPEMNGIEALKVINVRFPEARIIMLSIHKDVYYIKEAIGLGAKGYLTKNCMPDELVKAIKSVHGNRTYIEESLMNDLAFETLYGQNLQPSTILFSKREKEILEALCKGKSEKEIALLLNISVHTVHFHRMKLYAKTKSHSLSDLIRYSQSLEN